MRSKTFNDLLTNEGIDPEKVLVMRHAPKLLKLREALQRFAETELKTFNDYQRTQPPKVQPMLRDAKYLASFIEDGPGKARFVGLYEVGDSKPKSREELLRRRGIQELRNRGKSFDSPSYLWFSLRRKKSFDRWRDDRVVIRWPGERARCRWAHRNTFPVISFPRTSTVAPTAPAVEEEAARAADIKREKRAGFQSNPRIRKAVEDHAMAVVAERLRNDGYNVLDVSKDRKGYDLEAVRGQTTKFVEVKGTQTSGGAVVLTAGEVRFACANPARCALYIVYGISITDTENPKPSGGTVQLQEPFDPSKGQLEPIAYTYQPGPAPMADIEKARQLFRHAGLAFPTIPQKLAARLRAQGNSG